MGFNQQELRKIVNFMRKNGVFVFRNANFEIKLSRQAFKLPKPKIVKSEMETSQPPMDLSLWSAPDWPQEQA